MRGSAGDFWAPVTIRTPCGGGIRGGQTHSQSPEGIFTHVCGIKVVMPCNPYDAKGLLIASIEDDDPVVFFEPKRLYNGPVDGDPNNPAVPWSKEVAGVDAALGEALTVMRDVLGGDVRTTLDVLHGSARAFHEAQQQLEELRRRFEAAREGKARGIDQVEMPAWRQGDRPYGGEQPIEVAYAVCALTTFHEVFPDAGYDRLKTKAFE